VAWHGLPLSDELQQRRDAESSLEAEAIDLSSGILQIDLFNLKWTPFVKDWTGGTAADHHLADLQPGTSQHRHQDSGQDLPAFTVPCAQKPRVISSDSRFVIGSPSLCVFYMKYHIVISHSLDLCSFFGSSLTNLMILAGTRLSTSVSLGDERTAQMQ
jgi:hypothetical protein